MSCNHSSCPESLSDDKNKNEETVIIAILSLVENYLSFLPEDGTAFRDRYYLSKYFNLSKQVAIRIGKKLKSNLSYVEIKNLGMDILNTIEWEDINKSSTLQSSIPNLQEICNQHAQQIVILSFESARNSLLLKGEPDNEETSNKAIEIVRKKFPNVPIQYQKEELVDKTQEVKTETSLI